MSAVMKRKPDEPVADSALAEPADPTHDQLLEAEELASRGTMAGFVVLLLVFFSASALLLIDWLVSRGVL